MVHDISEMPTDSEFNQSKYFESKHIFFDKKNCSYKQKTEKIHN